MEPSAKSFQGEPRGSISPGRTTALRFGFARLVSCLILALAMSLFFAPGKAQAHGMHGAMGATAPIAVTDGLTTADALGGPEVSVSSCVTCCASSGCVAGSVPETFDLFDVNGPKSDFQPASTAAVYQMAQLGVRRPPKHTS